MNTRRPVASLLAGALILVSPGLSSRVAAQDVTHATRVDEKNRVFVDVENDSKVDIVVSSAVVSFYDKKGTLLDKSTIECDEDCVVKVDSFESFGPIEGPKGWDTVSVTKVYYDDVAKETPKPARAPRPQQRGVTPNAADAPPAPSAPVTPAPSAAVSASPRPDRKTIEGAIRSLYAALAKGDVAEIRSHYTPFMAENLLGTLGADGLRRFAKEETKGGTVKSLAIEPNETLGFARIEITYADGSKAKRGANLKKDGGAWLVENVDPV